MYYNDKSQAELLAEAVSNYMSIHLSNLFFNFSATHGEGVDITRSAIDENKRSESYAAEIMLRRMHELKLLEENIFKKILYDINSPFKPHMDISKIDKLNVDKLTNMCEIPENLDLTMYYINRGKNDLR